MPPAPSNRSRFLLSFVLLLLLSTGVSACNKHDEPRNKNNPVGQYINQPKDGAQAAKQKVEMSQQETDDQLKELEGGE